LIIYYNFIYKKKKKKNIKKKSQKIKNKKNEHIYKISFYGNKLIKLIIFLFLIKIIIYTYNDEYTLGKEKIKEITQ